MHTPRARILILTALLLIVAGYGFVNEYSRRRIFYFFTAAALVDSMKIYPHPDDHVMTPILIDTGTWEPTETALFRRILGSDDVVIDVGANVGYYTVIGSKIVGEKGRVIAFEPDPVNFSLLTKAVLENSLTNVTLEQKALSDKPGKLKLYLSEENKGDHRVFDFEQPRESIEVEAVPLDSYLKNLSSPVDFIKVDTQGAEVIILRGMTSTLQQHSDIRLAIEFWPHGLSGSGFSATELLDILEEQQFILYDIDERTGLVSETSREALLKTYTLENQRHTNLLATRKALSANEIK